ncbi:MAG TPA: DUF3742 family protein [Burkholderiaceae bacterium]
MKSTAPSTFAERVGRSLGRLWWQGARADRRAMHWLMAKGWPSAAARAAMLAIKVAAFVVLLYAMFWLALLLGLMLAGAWMMQKSSASHDDEHRPEWKDGPAGFGLYTYDGYRIDPHVSDDD